MCVGTYLENRQSSRACHTTIMEQMLPTTPLVKDTTLMGEEGHHSTVLVPVIAVLHSTLYLYKCYIHTDCVGVHQQQQAYNE